jgi:hypothetical protein
MEYDKFVTATFVKLSIFAALTILATILMTAMLTQIVFADTCSYDCDYNWDCGYNYDYDCGCIGDYGEVAPSRPADRFEQETVWTTVKVHNTDDHAHWYDVSTYLCETDCGKSCPTQATDCREMRCDASRVYVLSDQTKYVKCSRFVRYPNFYRVKVEWSIDSSTETRTAYSESFEVISDCDDCTREDGYGDFRCFGSFLQERYRNDDCESRWKVVDYCEYGCESAACVTPTVQPKAGEPTVFMQTSYEMRRGELSSMLFSIQNEGDADTFEITVSGEAAGWVDTPQLVHVGEGETKEITAYATVPSNAETGMHEFTITASAKTSDSAVGFIGIEKRGSGIFALDPLTDLLLVMVVIAIVVGAIWFRERIGFTKPSGREKPLGMSNRREPERFRDKCKDSLDSAVSRIKLLI